MNGSASECSSGCESGWTTYLETSLSGNCCKRGGGAFSENFKGKGAKVEYEEEDLSMVSDASSGPPHFHEDEDCCDENGCICSASSASAAALGNWKKSNKRLKMEEHQRQQQEEEEHPSFLDDTANSSVLGFSKNYLGLTRNQASMEHVLDFSQGLTATHFKNGSTSTYEFLKGRSAFQKNFG